MASGFQLCPGDVLARILFCELVTNWFCCPLVWAPVSASGRPALPPPPRAPSALGGAAAGGGEGGSPGAGLRVRPPRAAWADPAGRDSI